MVKEGPGRPRRSECNPDSHLNGAPAAVFVKDAPEARLIGDVGFRIADPGPVEQVVDVGPDLEQGGFPEWQSGALDFAGGTVVHINAAVAGLVGAYMVGKRIGYGKEAMAPHSLTLTMTGAALLWVGWFGFNAGSALEANGFAALAFINTLGATAAAVLAWCVGEALMKGKASMLGADDSLDVFGVHGIGGILGALLTGVFNSPSLGGPGYVADWVTASMVTAADYSIASQVWIQAKAVLTTVIWSGVVAFIAYKVVDLTIGLRVSEEHEREGLDITSHGETAYSR